MRDFGRVRDGLYATRVDREIISVLRLEPWKGAAYSFSWGVSLAYVPDDLIEAPRFHRTEKASRLDLWEDSRSVAEREGMSWRWPLVSRFSSESDLSTALDDAIAWATSRSVPWW